MYREILRKGIPFLAVIVTLVVVGFGVYSKFSPKDLSSETNLVIAPDPALENKPPFTVQRGNVTREINLTGQITSTTNKQLSFRAGGPIDKILIKKNDKVKSGQLLANLYLSKIQFDLKRAQINLDIDKLNLELEKQQPRLVSQNVQDINLAIKQKQIDLAELEIQDISATIDDMQIISPMDATVTAIFLKEGDLANVFEPIIEIADLTKLEVAASASGEDLRELAINMPVTMYTTNAPENVLTGVVTSIPGKISNNITTQYSDDLVHISLNENALSSGFQYGDEVQASTIVESKNNVLWLPPNAISTDGGHSYVIVKDNQGQHKVEIKPGLKTNSRVEILEGLSEGQGVYLP
jgi:RND family efflux transporter MFP subunit